MKSVLLFVLALALSSCATSSGTRPDKVDVPPLEFEAAKPERLTLNNGITVYYVQDEELPLMGGTIYFKGGRLFEPKELVGVSSAAGSQMRQGGILGMSIETLNTRLDTIGADVESSFGDEYGSASFSSLAEDFDEVCGLFSRMLKSPSFDNKQLELWKRLAAEGVRRRQESPDTIAQMTFSEVVYGPDSVYGRHTSYNTISRISRNDLLDFHRRFVRPQGAIMALSGSVSKEAMLKTLNKHLGDWNVPAIAPEVLPQLGEGLPADIYLVQKEFDQAVVFMGHRGPPRLTPDMYAMNTFNRIFGSGGFDTTLVSEVRSKLGLAYVVAGELSPGPIAGTFDVYVATRSAEVGRAITRILELIEESREQAPQSVRVANAKEAVKRSFVFKFDSSLERADRAAVLEMLDYPKDYDAEYLANTDKVDGDAVRAVAKKWIKPEDIAIVVVGKVTPEQLEKQFGRKVHLVQFETEPIY